MMNNSREPRRIILRPAWADDEAAWRDMWSAYCTFYEQTLPESVTTSVWARSQDPSSQINTVMAWDEIGTPLGFANYVLHPHTWSDKTLCYLEDLFVRPEARGRSVGHSLIEYLIETGKAQGWGRVYWHTETGNSAARRLYDRFKPADDFVRYTVCLQD